MMPANQQKPDDRDDGEKDKCIRHRAKALQVHLLKPFKISGEKHRFFRCGLCRVLIGLI